MVYLTQCKCPHNHCIMALAWEGEEHERAGAETMLKNKMQGLFDSGAANARCGLCLSVEFHYTTHRTIWKTIDEATPHLRESESQQRLTASILSPLNSAKRKASH